MTADANALAGLSILVVEDEVLIAFSLKAHLLDAGAKHVDTIGTLAEVAPKLRDVQYDVVVLDVRLPDGEAYDLAQKLLKQGMPLVVHSGHATSSRTGMLEGAFYCAKPATPAEVQDAIVSSLSTSR